MALPLDEVVFGARGRGLRAKVNEVTGFEEEGNRGGRFRAKGRDVCGSILSSPPLPPPLPMTEG